MLSHLFTSFSAHWLPKYLASYHHIFIAYCSYNTFDSQGVGNLVFVSKLNPSVPMTTKTFCYSFALDDPTV